MNKEACLAQRKPHMGQVRWARFPNLSEPLCKVGLATSQDGCRIKKGNEYEKFVNGKKFYRC